MVKLLANTLMEGKSQKKLLNVTLILVNILKEIFGYSPNDTYTYSNVAATKILIWYLKRIKLQKISNYRKCQL